MSEYAYITYKALDEGRLARIMLDRPDARNAQHRGLLVELNAVFLRAEATTRSTSSSSAAQYQLASRFWISHAAVNGWSMSCANALDKVG